MKKLLLTFVIIIAVNCKASNDNHYIDLSGMTRIELKVSIDNFTNHPQNPKAPVLFPNVYQDGHTLYLISGCDNSSIILKDESGTEVYSTNVTEGGNIINLQEYLSGTYVLHIHRGIFYFYATIEL